MNDEQKAEARAAKDLKEGFLSLWVIAGKLADENGYRHGSAARREFLEEIDRAAMAGAFDVFSRKVRAPIEKPQSINGEVHAFESEVRDWLQRDKRKGPRPGLLPQSDNATSPLRKPVQRQAAQEAAILAKLAELGFEATALPVAPAGKASPAKRAVREALCFSADVMNKAWQRLRTAGNIRDARP